MPMRTNRMKRDRSRRPHSELDWFAEDPWAEPDEAMFDNSSLDWELDSWASTDDDLAKYTSDDEEDDEEDDETGGWGPIRRRTKRARPSR